MRTVAAAVLVLALVAPAGAAETRRATLALKTLAPLVVEGRGFIPRERVVMTANGSGARRILTIVSGRDGRFRARFRLSLGRCTELTVKAVGARGSRAILQVQPNCS